jgi:hypothetical protein
MLPRQESPSPSSDSDFNLDIGLGQTRDNVNGSRNHPGPDESLVDVVTGRKTRMSRCGERFRAEIREKRRIDSAVQSADRRLE